MPLTNRLPFVAGNWKMNKTINEARTLAAEVAKASLSLLGAEIVLCPPFTSLYEVAKTIEGSSVQLGGQDLFWEDWGAYTGEISSAMLRDAGCQYVITGHSERRHILGETDEMINRKVKAALRQGVFPILCVGETLEEREAGTTLRRLEVQIEKDLQGIGQDDFSRVIIAYEPVWAIGTGKTATPEMAAEAHRCLRGLVKGRFGEEAAARLRILYGGSVKPDNIRGLMAQPEIDGALVGGASLDPISFASIVNF